ncbi:MAG: hypothetical protein FWC16_07365 [Defluviitaleaceae bacterium]|nr:hypothetical protein [Defluviitaleaceae bacterium]MCL2274732.1 hypothetical protein [Defluviitaleaceae bacterium]
MNWKLRGKIGALAILVYVASYLVGRVTDIFLFCNICAFIIVVTGAYLLADAHLEKRSAYAEN